MHMDSQMSVCLCMPMFLNPLLIYTVCILPYVLVVNASYLLKALKIPATFLLSEVRNTDVNTL